MRQRQNTLRCKLIYTAISKILLLVARLITFWHPSHQSNLDRAASSQDISPTLLLVQPYGYTYYCALLYTYLFVVNALLSVGIEPATQLVPSGPLLEARKSDNSSFPVVNPKLMPLTYPSINKK